MKKEVRMFFKENGYNPKKKPVLELVFSYRDLIDFAYDYNVNKDKKLKKISIRVQETTELYIIHKAICEFFRCSDLDLFIRTRKREIVRIRQWFHYMARKHNPECKLSYKEIGNYYSDITLKPFKHDAVLHSVTKILGYISRYSDDIIVERELDIIIERIKKEEAEKITIEALRNLKPNNHLK
jgi:chromosomal replication initiation ATPase DnaA